MKSKKILLFLCFPLKFLAPISSVETNYRNHRRNEYRNMHRQRGIRRRKKVKHKPQSAVKKAENSAHGRPLLHDREGKHTRCRTRQKVVERGICKKRERNVANHKADRDSNGKALLPLLIGIEDYYLHYREGTDVGCGEIIRKIKLKNDKSVQYELEDEYEGHFLTLKRNYREQGRHYTDNYLKITHR